jgi:site-specific DNA-methyltransferase (adenine-specific)
MRPIFYSSDIGDVVLDPFVGSGTTAVAAYKTGRRYICGDVSAKYARIAQERIRDTDPYQPTRVDDTGMMQRSLFEVLERDDDGFLMKVETRA